VNILERERQGGRKTATGRGRDSKGKNVTKRESERLREGESVR
jgi:hypothetical protein